MFKTEKLAFPIWKEKEASQAGGKERNCILYIGSSPGQPQPVAFGAHD